MKKVLYDSLIEKIYQSLIYTPDYGLGEMAACREEAERIVNSWMKENKIILDEK